MRQLHILSFLLLIIYSCGNTTEKEKNTLINTDQKLYIEKRLSKHNKELNCLIEFKRFENDNLVQDFTEYGALAFTRFEGETATVSGFSGIDNGIGFLLLISKDTCIVKYNALSTNEIFKLNKNEKSTFGVMVPCKSEKVSLCNDVKYMNGEIISGKIEFESDDYYEIINNKENRVKVEMKAIFKSEPMPVIDGKYKTLIKK